MTTTAITTEMRLKDAALEINHSLTRVEADGIGWFIDTHKDGLQLLKVYNDLDVWCGSQLERVANICNANGLLWWVSTAHFIEGEYTGAKVFINISLP